MRRNRSVVAALLAVAVGLTVPGVAAAESAPQKVRCNMLVTQNLTLTANVHCATGTGFRLAPGVTLDLGGYRVRGSAGNTGVVMSEDGTSKVVNGSMKDWTVAVSYENWGDIPEELPLVSNLKVTGSTLSVGPGHLDVRDSAFTGSAIEVANGRITLERTSVVDGRVWVFSAWSTVKDSTFTRSTLQHVSSGRTEISTSTFDGGGSTDKGIDCSDAAMTLTDTIVRNYTTGVDASCLQVAERNRFSGNGVGLRFVRPMGALDEEPWLDVRNNTFVSNGVGAELQFAVRFSDNTLAGNGTGVTIAGDHIRYIEGNVVTGSTDTGIVAGGPRDTITRNTVTGGGGQGIVAVGSLDGGGNVASGNAVEPQCEGVLCLPN